MVITRPFEPTFAGQTRFQIFSIARQPKHIVFQRARSVVFKMPISSRVKRHNRKVLNWLNFLATPLRRHALDRKRAAPMAALKCLKVRAF
jgi:hypothetical protein